MPPAALTDELSSRYLVVTQARTPIVYSRWLSGSDVEEVAANSTQLRDLLKPDRRC
jgi:hypothetical protein